ncbi:hypothetical protein BHE74_00037046, partial [Ensete ventricosum]
MEKCLFPIVTFYFVENLFASQFAFLQIMRLENEFSAYKVRAHALLHKKDAELAEAKNSELLKSLEQAVKKTRIVWKPRFSLSSGKTPYRSVHTSLAADRNADRAVPLKSAIDDRFRLLAVDFDCMRRLTEKSTVGGRLKKKKGKEEEKKKDEVPGRCSCLRALAARGSTASRHRSRVATR